HRVDEEIDRSRFITTVAYTPTVEDARAFIDQMRAEFGDATHNCWAYLVGPPGSTGQIGYSDDGEPHGTAGKPMWTVLHHSNVGDISAVVTRYFGGILLGKGGLVRAYSGGVKLALETLPLAVHRPTVDLLVVIDYASVTPVQRVLAEFGATLQQEDYGVDVTYYLRLPADQSPTLQQRLVELTNGQVLIEAGP
ncbi:MAG TPA: YigZ family protein, partial [Anaerolineae bacterium]|nr:YigZ family protein [Anaerolineae bacterium]HNU04224.1 YigZ family protein [Anaerolineae bacterium]